MKRIASLLLAIAGLSASLAHAEAPPPSRHCGTLEAFEVRAESRSTTCDFAIATARKVHRVAFGDSGIKERFSLQVRGHRMGCRHFFVERRELIVCKGAARAVRLVYAF